MQDLTMSQVMKDPMIRLMLRADKVSLGEFAKLLEKASNDCGQRFAVAPHGVCTHQINADCFG